MELCEVLTGWEQKNKYQVKDLRVFWNLIYFSLPDLRLSRTRDLLHEGGKQLLHEVSIQVVRLNVHQAWGNKNNWWFGDFYHLLPRQCCGPNRPFNFHVTDPAGLEVLHFKRFLPTWSWSTYMLGQHTKLHHENLNRDCVCAPCGWPNCFCCLCPCQ